MNFIIENYLIVIALSLLLIALISGWVKGGLWKFSVAGLNWMALVFLLSGLFVYIQHKKSNASLLDIEKKQQELNNFSLSSHKVDEATIYVDGAAISLNRINVFLDFSGSVLPASLYNQIKTISGLLKNAKEIHFYYFGSCMGEIKNFDNLTVNQIVQIQESFCPGSKMKIKSNTDIIKTLEETSLLLRNAADNKTLCLYITDDMQSPVPKYFSSALTKINVDLAYFKEQGVIFELIKLGAAKKNIAMSSATMSGTFNVDYVIGQDDLLNNIQRILQNRIVANDLKPQSSEKNKLQNEKISFLYTALPTKLLSKKIISVKIKNQYKTYPLIIKPDSITSDDWKAVFYKEGEMPFYVSVKNNEDTLIELPLTIYEGDSHIHFINQSFLKPVKTYYSIIYPASNQYNIKKLFDTINTPFSTLHTAPFSGQLVSHHYSSSTNTFKKTIPFWIYFVFSIFSFITGLLLRYFNRQNSSLAGWHISITNTSNAETEQKKFSKHKRVKNYVFQYNGQPCFKFTSIKTRMAPLGLLKQPLDKVRFTSLLYPLFVKTKHGEVEKPSLNISKNWKKEINVFSVILKR